MYMAKKKNRMQDGFYLRYRIKKRETNPPRIWPGRPPTLRKKQRLPLLYCILWRTRPGRNRTRLRALWRRLSRADVGLWGGCWRGPGGMWGGSRLWFLLRLRRRGLLKGGELMAFFLLLLLFWILGFPPLLFWLFDWNIKWEGGWD